MIAAFLVDRNARNVLIILTAIPAGLDISYQTQAAFAFVHINAIIVLVIMHAWIASLDFTSFSTLPSICNVVLADFLVLSASTKVLARAAAKGIISLMN